MEEEGTILEKIVADEADIKDYDIESDFDDGELRILLDAGIIFPCHLSDCRASDMIINDMLSYEEYPFEEFSNYEKVRQLEQKVISKEEFKSKAELEYFDGDDWLDLLNVWKELDTEAPWAMIRDEARADHWFAFLSDRPERACKADWKRLCEQGSLGKYFKMLEKQPALYEFCPDKKKLTDADSGYWVDLIIEQPDFAAIYPMKKLDRTEDIVHLLLHRPELTNMLTWDKDNPPVRLYIENHNPTDPGTLSTELVCFVSTEISPAIQEILQNILLYGKRDAARQANSIAHTRMTFAGVYSTRMTEEIMQKFRDSVAEKDLALSIKSDKFTDSPRNIFLKN